MVKRIMLFLFAIAFALQISLADNTYKLASNCQDGVILHCFDWTFNQIKNRIPEIAAAGYTSVQTSPAQANGGGSTWYWLYDPYGFRLGNALGSQQDLTNLCTEASKYGVKVIVDVVANHLAGGDSGKAGYYSGIDSEFKNDEYWHDRIDNIDYGNRYSITRGRIGLPDLNSENSFVQGKVKDYIATLKSCGVSGIRWDAAKHIALPQDWDNASGSFWSNVLDHTMYNYGEVLDSPCSSDDGTLSKRYCSLMSITDNNYGNGVAGCINSGNTSFGYGNLTVKGCSESNLVLWAESHDTYANDGGQSRGYSTSTINKAWAVVASRKGYSALYLSRPTGSCDVGLEGSSNWKDKEVVAVNHFHNAMIGQSEYFNIDNGTVCVLRGKGCVLVKPSGSGSVSVANKNATVAAGNYTDEVTGNTFVVTASTITGSIGSTGVAVVYAGYDGSTTGGGSTGGDTGGDTNIDTSKIVLNEGEQAVFFEKPSTWSGVNAWVWNDETNFTGGTWPGQAATNVTGNVYKWIYTNTSTVDGKVIFNDGSNQSDKAGFTYVNGGYYTIDGLKKTISVKTGGGTGGSDTTKTGSDTTKVELANGEQAVFFVRPSSWASKINAYVWQTASPLKKYTGAWPGEEATNIGGMIYKWKYAGTDTIAGGVIFNDGSNQTKDLTWVNGGYYGIDGLEKTITPTGGGTGGGGTEDNTKISDWTIYFIKPDGWGSTENAYVYDDETGTTEKLSEWPGTSMSLDGNYYKLQFTMTITKGKGKLLFNDGSNQAPAQNQPGFVLYNNGLYNSNGFKEQLSGIDGISANSFKAYASGGLLYISAPKSMSIVISGIDGKTSTVQLTKGQNVISSLPHGFYIVNGIKIML